MKFVKWSFFIVCLFIALSLLVTGCMQLIGAQTASYQVTSANFDNSNYVSESVSVTNSSDAMSALVISKQSDSTSQASILENSSSLISSSSFNSTSSSSTAPAVSKVATKVNTTIIKVPVKVTVNVLPTPTPKTTTTPTPTPKPLTINKIVLDKLIGQSLTQVISVFGQPKAKELSEYGFTWYVYNSDYKRFIMIGIANDKVVGVYSNSSSLSFVGLSTGKARNAVRSALLSGFGKPLTSIQKGNTRYIINSTEQRDIFFNGSSYTTIFYDNIEGGILTSIQIIAKDTELSIGYYGVPSTALAASFERTSFYLANAIRARKGLALYTWDNKMATIARSHSTDMNLNNYFSHTNLLGQSSSGRFSAAGLTYKTCSENIAKNHTSAITAHESYMNSSGHRKNLLNSCKNLGVGVYMANGAILLTQDFITYR